MNRPETLSDAEKSVWDELAPFAIQGGTLVPKTVSAFVLLCRNVVLERQLAASPFAGGPNHRGLLQWVASRYKDFALAPFGKPIVVVEKPMDPFAEFDQVAQ